MKMLSIRNKIRNLALFASVLLAMLSGMPLTAVSAEATCTPGAGKNLAGCDFSGQRLAYASFQSSNLTGANFSNTMLNSARFDGANLAGAIFNGASLQGTVMSNVKAEGASFEQAGAVNTNFNFANLTKASFNLADIRGATFSGATLNQTRFGYVARPPGSLPGGWTYLAGFIFGPTADLSWANLDGIDLGNRDLSKANLQGVKSLNLRGSPILPAGWILVGGMLIGPHANLSEAQLGSLDLSEADLSGSYSGGISGSPKLPTDWSLNGGYLIGPKANLESADLTGLDLSNAKLTGVSSGYIVGSPKMPSGYQLIKGWIIGPEVDLSGAALFDINLTGVNLARSNLSSAFFLRANLNQANIQGANIEGARFQEAMLSGIRSGNLVGVPHLPTGFGVVKGYLLGPSADLTNADLSQESITNISFSGANLSGANFTNSNFTNCDVQSADFKEARMEGVTSSNVQGPPASLPLNWKFQNGTFVPPKYFESTLNAPKIVSHSGILYASETSTALDVSVTFKWSKDGKQIPNQGGSQYVLKAEDLGHVFEVTATYSKDGYVSATYTSRPLTPSRLPVRPIPFMAFPEDESGHVRILFNAGAAGQLVEDPSLFAWSIDNGATWNVESPGVYPTFQAPNNSYLDAHTGVMNGTVSIKIRGMNSGGWGPVSKAILVSTSSQLEPETFQVVGNRRVGGVLQVRNKGSIQSGITRQYQWFRDGEPIPANNTDRYLILPSDSGRQISVQVVGQRYGYSPSSLTSEGLDIAPPFESLIFSRKPTVGKTIRVRADKLSNRFSYTYTWFRDGQEIEEASAPKLLLSAADLNRNLSARVCARHLGQLVFCKTSSLTEPISRASVPKPIAAIQGTPKPGNRLLSVPGSWHLGGDSTFQWFRDGAPIIGSENGFYDVLPSDIGHRISYKLSWNKAGYMPLVVNSSAKKVSQ